MNDLVLDAPKIGRPFVGEVSETTGFEGDVRVKRSVFRCMKKFWGKKKYLSYKKGAFFRKLETDLKLLTSS